MFNDKIILITWGTWTWWQAIVENLLESYKPEKIIVFSRSEDKQVKMQRVFNSAKLTFILGDIRNKDLLLNVTDWVDYVIHAAALKHINKCEENCNEAIEINIIWTQNIIDVSIKNKVKKVLYISTDKAVEPYNLYGNTKAISEKLIINANTHIYNKWTTFFILRAWNVLWSSGSVLEVFYNQIKASLPITITHFEMHRFYITLDEIIKCILFAFDCSRGWEIFIPKCGVSSLRDLLKIMLSVYWKGDEEINEIWARHGEKLNEVLISKSEVAYAYTVNNRLYLIDLLNRNTWAYPKVDFLEYATFSAEKYNKTVMRDYITHLFRNR